MRCMTAFFLEAGFLGVMLFGMQRVGKGLHFFATLMVAVGTLISAFWILSANSWMQTPAGYIVNAAGQFLPVSWWEIVFNPSFPYRLVHMVLAAYLTTALVVGAAGAFHLLRDNRNEGARVMFSMAMWMATLVAPIQIFAGDQHGLNTLEHQPVKVMAMEGHFRSHPARRAADPVRISRSGEGRDALLDRNPEGVVADPQAFARCAAAGTGHGAARRTGRRSASCSLRFRIMVGLGLSDACCLGCSACSCAGAAPSMSRSCCTISRWRWDRRASSRCWPAGPSPRPAASPTPSMACCARSIPLRPLAAPAVTMSLLAFAVVYFFVFAMGTYYILHLMAAAAAPGRRRTAARTTPTHAAGITPVPPGRQRHRRRSHSDGHRHRPADDLGLRHRLRGVRLCGDGRLRPRARHAVSVLPEARRPQRHDEFRRAGVGRQRNLAGAGRRRTARGISPRLCDPDAGAVHADDRHAARARAARRGVRIPLADDARAEPVGYRLCGRLVHRGAGAGNRARRDPAGHHRRKPAIRRRLVGLADTVLAADRAPRW